MPANLNNPFGESCCDGGICDATAMSAQPCGCDPGCKPKPHVCQRHELEAVIKQYDEDYKRKLNDESS